MTGRARMAALLVPAALVLAQAGAAAVVPAAPTIGEKPDAVSASASATFTFTATGAEGFECSLDGATFTVCTSPVDYTGLAEGGHTFAVQGIDAEGAGPPATYTWTVDTTLPALTLVSPADGAATNDPTTEVAGIGGIAPGDEDTVHVQVRAGAGGGGQPIRRLNAAVDPLTGAWSVAVEPALEEGVYNVKADQRDAAGNSVETPRHVFTLDVTAPEAPTLTGPPLRTGSTSAQIGISHGEPGVTFRCTLGADPEAACTSPAAYTGLADGFHEVAVRAVDAAGNAGPPATWGWTVDTTPPPAAITSPAAGSATSDLTPAITGTAGTATGDGASVTVRLHAGGDTSGALVQEGSVSVGADGAWTFAVAQPLPLGQYTVTASQTDDVGNVGTAGPRTFAVDVELPSVGLTAPANNSATTDTTPAFAGTADQAAITVSVYAGTEPSGTPVLTVPVTVANGMWSVEPASPLPDGTYAIAASATNLKGTATANRVFHVDTAPPSFTSVPASQTLEEIDGTGTPFPYAVTAADQLDPSPEVDCSPAPGSVFPRGATVVECTATDWVGHTAEASFTVTVANTIAPASVAGFSAQGANGRVRLRWTLPADWDFARVVVSRAARGKSNWRQVVSSSSATSFVDRKVANDRVYDYRAVSVDTAGNVSPLVVRAARPSAFLAPAWGAEVPRPPVLRWAAKRGARYYNVQLWRGGRKILSRWPKRPRYALSSAWKFNGRRHTLAPGTYVAYAWPGIGPKSAGRYGKRIGWTKFVVPARR